MSTDAFIFATPPRCSEDTGMRKYISAIVLCLATVCVLGADEKKETSDMARKLEIAKAAITGRVPIASEINAITKKAESENTESTWIAVADACNTYGNAVAAISDSYHRQYVATIDSEDFGRWGNRALLQKSADYESIRNAYFSKRNAAYMRIAKLHLDKGNRENALAYAMTVLDLSGSEANPDAEAMIKQLIELK